MKQLSKTRLDPSGSDFIGGITGKHTGCRVLGSLPEALGGDPTFPVPHCLVEDVAEQSDFLESFLFTKCYFCTLHFKEGFVHIV